MLKELNPLLHSELRLGVVSLLAGVECADFSFLRQQTGASAGNLSIQLEKLAAAGYVSIEKGYKGKRPQTMCRLTEQGKDALTQYVEALRSYLPL